VRETAEDRLRDQERRDYADKYEGADMRIDSHWSEKKREQMTDRDWRIFRWAPRKVVAAGAGRAIAFVQHQHQSLCLLEPACTAKLTFDWHRPGPSLIRLCREDFSISYKGVNPALPIRNWEEANLPKSLRQVRHAGKPTGCP
jgi:ATP-dependent RNA helicase DDX23/PRP28